MAPSRATVAGHIEDVDGDGDLDLALHFRTQDTGIECGDTPASLAGETFSGQANIASRAYTFKQFYWTTAAISGTAFSPGSNDGTSYQIAYDRVDGDHYSGWEIVLPETDVSNLSQLAFDIRGQLGGEIPNVWLASPHIPGRDTRNLVDIENCVKVKTSWQRVEIPLTDFHVTGSSGQDIGLTRIVRVQIVFEWDDMAGMVYVDGFAFG